MWGNISFSSSQGLLNEVLIALGGVFGKKCKNSIRLENITYFQSECKSFIFFIFREIRILDFFLNKILFKAASAL